MPDRLRIRPTPSGGVGPVSATGSTSTIGSSDNRPTLQDIAHRTGLSVATVSRALHRDNSPNVSGETRLRVQALAREMGYQPNLLSRSLATGKTQTVSYWTYDAFAPYYAMVAREICQQAARRGYYLHIHNTFHPAVELDPSAAAGGGGATKALAGESPALALNFDGVIACDVAYEGNQFAARLHHARVPMVGIGINYPPDCDFVGIDLALGAERAMTHLLESGCRRIVHVCQPDARENKDRRALVYAQRMEEAGLPVEWLFCRHERSAARDVVAAYTRKKPVPDAFFCVNDEVAVGCYRGLTDAGIAVPDDVLLVGCDGIVETEYQHCPLTTIAAPVAAMCDRAWDFLQARLREPERPLQQVLLPPELMIRRSSTGKKSE